jgi:Rod binding domain-containing protein
VITIGFPDLSKPLTVPTQGLDFSAIQAARAKEAAIANTPNGRKLRKAAAEFESQLLANLWKSMKTTFAASADESTDPASQSLEDYGIESMCRAVGRAGGLGIGKLVVHSLESRLGQASSNSQVFQNGKVAQ